MRTKAKVKTGILLLFFSIVLKITSFSQVPVWEWAKGVEGSHSEDANSVAVDASGNVYVFGSFTSLSIVLGSNILTNIDTIGPNYFTDAFLVKYDASGSVLWAKSIRGTSHEWSGGIALDINGNIYITGSFNSNIVWFEGLTINNSWGDFCAFIAKYDPSGNVIWAKKGASATSYNYHGNSICLDEDGNSYVTGYVYYPWSSDYFYFIYKYDASGNYVWSSTAALASGDYVGGASIAVDASGNSYVTGRFGLGYLTFGSTVLGNSSSTTSAAFIVSYDILGNVRWAKEIDGSGSESGSSIKVDETGNVYVTGSFSSSSVAVGNITLTKSGTADTFIAKYDTLGNVSWAKSIGGASNTSAQSMVVDADGSFYIAGNFTSPGMFVGNTLLTNAGNTDAWIAKCDSLGNILWAKSMGGADQDYCRTIAVDTNQNCYIAGYFHSSAISFENITVTNAGSLSDAFIAKLTTPAAPVASFTASTTSICQSGCIDFTDGSTYGPSSWSWSFVGAVPASSTAQNPANICYSTPGTYTIKLVVTNGIGSDSISHTITVYENPTTAMAGSDQTTCATATTLGANTPVNGTGLWTLVSGSGSIATPTLPASGVSGLGAGTNTFRWTISNGPCTVSTDEVNIVVSPSPTTANAGANQQVCTTSATLYGNTAVSGTGTWTLVSGQGTITSPSSHTSGVTGLGIGTNIFQWTITTDSCGSSTDQVAITAGTPLGTPTISMAGNVLTCSPSYTSYQWYNGTTLINGATGQSYTITQNANYRVVVWASGCSASSALFSVVPANDECMNAIPLISDIIVNYSSGTTENGSQSEPAIECHYFTGNADDDVWYKFTAVSLAHTVQVQGASGFNTVVDVRMGSCSGASIGCADDGIGYETLDLTDLTIGDTYYIRVYDYGSGGDDFQIAVTHPFSTSIGSFNNEELTVALYPNPTRDIVKIEWSQTTTDKFSFVLYNSIGKLVKQFSIVNNMDHTASISLESIPEGIYFFSLIGNDGKIKKGKIVKE